MTTSLVQLSDTHVTRPDRLVGGRIDTSACLRNAVATVLAMPQAPDAVVITGDLVDAGGDEEYEQLARLISPLPMPVYLMPGNHDDREALRRGFRGHAYLESDDANGFVQFSVRIGALRLIALDTLIAGRADGELCERRLEWLERALHEHADEPVVVAMHHPPFATGMAGMDTLGLARGAPALAALLARRSNVERVICGHAHRAIDVRFGGTIASVAPSPAYQTQLDWSPAAPIEWMAEPPAFRVHLHIPGTGLVTHLKPVGGFDGPFSFDDHVG